MKYVLINTVDIFSYLLTFFIFVRIVISWLPIKKDNMIVNFFFMTTEPILAPIRSLLSKSPLGGPGMILDFSPIIAYLLIEVCRSLLNSLIIML